MVKKQNSIFKLYVLTKVAGFGFFLFYFEVKEVSADKCSFIQHGLHTNGNSNCLRVLYLGRWGYLKKKKKGEKNSFNRAGCGF